MARNTKTEVVVVEIEKSDHEFQSTQVFDLPLKTVVSMLRRQMRAEGYSIEVKAVMANQRVLVGIDGSSKLLVVRVMRLKPVSNRSTARRRLEIGVKGGF